MGPDWGWKGGDGPVAGWNSSARTAPARRAPPRVIERGVGEGKVEGRRGGGADVGAPRRGSGAQIGAERSMFFFEQERKGPGGRSSGCALGCCPRRVACSPLIGFGGRSRSIAASRALRPSRPRAARLCALRAQVCLPRYASMYSYLEVPCSRPRALGVRAHTSSPPRKSSGERC